MSIFYEKDVLNNEILLSEEESRHCSQVLRHEVGDEIIVFDGKGTTYHCKLKEVSRKKCLADITKRESLTPRSYRFHLAIAPTKNIDRMEWMVEKLCEIGIDEVTLLKTKHSERKKIRLDRLEKKAISAMKQSGNPFLPRINEIMAIEQFLQLSIPGKKLIAHVDGSHQYMGEVVKPEESITILIGPEGDFSLSELEKAQKSGFVAVSLGNTTLRTETAGLKACCFLSIINNS